MSFKEQFINSLKRRYNNQIMLEGVFEDIKKKLYELKKELNEFTRYDFDVDLNVSSDRAKLVIEDYFLMFQFHHEEDPPFIEIIWGKKGYYYTPERIELDSLNDRFNIDETFDYYLHKAFNDLLKELNEL